MIEIGVMGATGRMGKHVMTLLKGEYSDRAVTGGSIALGQYQSEEDLEPLLTTDALIDFSMPEAVLPLVRLALQTPRSTRLPVFIFGSTGWKPHQLSELEALCARTPVLVSSNFSTGVLAVQQILEQAAPLLRKLGYSPVIVDTHHRHKKDAPSGTALMLANTIIATSGQKADVHSIRAGEVIGEHEITFYGPADRITLGHFAQDRSMFARGAIEAALWLASARDSLEKSRILTMKDFIAVSLLQ
jgi:4-hydroxy-tetrahydrodipicolinate reductase